MTERDVTLTDFGLAALCFGLTAACLSGGGAAPLFAGLFASIGVAAVTGGLWHGWFSGQDRGGWGGALWLATMLLVGVTNLFLWLISDVAWRPGQPAGAMSFIAYGQLAIYALLAMAVTRDFRLASLFSLPPVLALLAGYGAAVSPDGPAVLWFGIAGLLLALIGAGMQAMKIGLGRLGLSHNALYHVVQGVALALLYASIPGVSALPATG